MTHDQLIILDAIIKSGSFNAASEKLHRSQPSLSMAIKKLEEEIDLKIFSRDKYRATLTKEGEAIYKKVKIILKHSDELFTLSKQLSIGSEPKIWIVIDSLFPLPLILESLKGFIDQFPDTEFTLTVEYLQGAMERIQDKDADLAITSIDNPVPNLESAPLLDVHLIPVAVPGFFSTTKGEISTKEMEKHIQILASDSSIHSSKRAAPLYPKNTVRYLEGGKHWTVNNNTTKKHFIMAGLGWGRLPSHFIEEELLDGRLIPLNLEGIKPAKIKMHLARNTHCALGPITEHLWKKIQLWSQEIIHYENQIEQILDKHITYSSTNSSLHDS